MAEEVKKKKMSKESFARARKVLKYLQPKWVFYLGLGLLLLSTIASLVFPRLLGQLAGVGIDSGQGVNMVNLGDYSFDFNDIGTIMVLILILFVVQGIAAFFRIYTFAIASENMMLSLRNEVYAKVIKMPMTFFDTRRVGELNSRISTDLSTIQNTFTLVLAEFIRQILVVIIGVAALFYFSQRLTTTMLLSLPVAIIIAIIFGRYVRRLSKRTQDEVAESNTIVEETLTGITAVKAFANEAFEEGRYAVRTKAIKKIAMKTALWRGLFSSFIIIFMFGVIAFIIMQASELMQSGDLNPGDFFTFLLYTALVAASFGGLASQYSAFQKGMGSIESVLDILEMDSEPVSETGDDILKLKGQITFENVGFHYETRPDIAVINDLSFEINPGEQVAIVGPSGAGKSTLVALLLRFYKALDGEIKFDGKDSAEMDLSDLRSNMAFVPQEIILFGGSIRENIAYGKVDASDDEIMQAAEKANALEFIDKFPEGLDTMVGERGVQLSGGQKQRIAIARAILKDPAILILDEATSSLDSANEKLVQKALDRVMEGRTSIVIAHRLSTVKNADKILVLEGGKLIEWGSHEDLIANDQGVYAELSRHQLA